MGMSFLLTFLEGLASFLSPCTLPLVPIYVAYFSAADDAKLPAFARALAFVLAFTLVFVTLGAFAGSVGQLLAAHRTLVRIGCGVMMMVFGLGFLGLFRLPLGGAGRARPVTGIVSAFLFGLAFALGLTPCVGAFLAAALLAAAAEGTALKGTLLLVTYSLGLGIPFVLAAVLLAKLKGAFAFMRRHLRAIEVISGLGLILAGGALALGETWRFHSTQAPAPSGTQPKEVTMEVTLTAANFETEVLKADRPVIVDFWATWCGPCQMLGPILAEIAEEKKDVLKVGKVNVDECPELAAQYGIMSIPAVFLFKDGKIVGQAVGYMPKDALLAELFKAVQ